MIRKTLTLLIVIFLLFSGSNYAEDLQESPSGPQLTPTQTEAFQKLTAEQRKAVEEAGQQKEGSLTPEAIELLQARPEFKGLTPQDIMQGKEMLEKKRQGTKATEQKTVEKKVVDATLEQKVFGDKSDKSIFERARNLGKYQEISTDLKPFGHDFFQESAIKVMTDRKDIPVPAEYVIGAGDEVKILLWGRVNANYSLVVDRNGNITIPQVGPVPVAGMTFEQMSKHLIKQSEQFVGANIDVTMGALKSIPVFVLGDVKRPGAYTIGSFATITDALIIAGGPSGIGTMRNIQLRRKDKVITAFDLYDLLLKGDKSKDTILQAGDVVFVPVAGPIVGIAGNVKRPAIYEMRGKYDLETLFGLAGGIIPTAYTQQIQVERVVRNERQVVLDIDDRHLTKTKDVQLQDIDLVKVFNIFEGESNVVFLNGNIKKPGKYEYKPGMRIRDLIKDQSELLSETYLEYALLTRLDPPNLEKRLIPFSLESILSNDNRAGNFELKAQDQIYIFSKWFFKDHPAITVEGEVRKGGKFALDKDTKVKDAILMAGDVTKGAYLEKGEIFRIDNKRAYSVMYFNVGRALEGDPTHNLRLQDEDRVVIHAIDEFEYKKLVHIDGDVLKPGKYPYIQGITVKDLVFAAGNILESAFIDDAEVTSQVVEGDKVVKLYHKNINLRKALKGEPTDNIQLKPYDRVMVKRLQDWRKENFVVVRGEVRYPGKYIIKKNEKLSALIERAGGYSDNAYLRGAVFTRTRVKDLQQKSLDEMVARMERELLAEASTVTASSSEGVQVKQVEIQQRQKFIEALKKLPPSGRMTIYIAHLRLLKGSVYDIELEEGDSLFVPTKNNVVNVTGAVMSNGSFIYNQGMGYTDYIRMAGGYSRYADMSNIFVVKVDGSARKLPSGLVNWNPFQKRWELDGFGEERAQIEAGDSIVIPELLDRTAWLRELKDITQIFANVGLTASSIALLYKTIN